MDIKSVRVKDRILLHLMRYTWYRDRYEVPLELSQYGMAHALGVGQDHVSYAMKDLKQKSLVEEKVCHVIGGQRRRKVYFLTDEGIRAAEDLKKGIEDSMITLKDGDDTYQKRFVDIYDMVDKMPTINDVLDVIEDGVVDLKALKVHLYAKDADSAGAQKGGGKGGGRGKHVAMISEMHVPRFFVGRSAELEVISKQIQSQECKAIVMYGIPGIGKTTLAAKVALNYRGERDIMWYRFHRWDTIRNTLTSISDFMLSIGRRNLHMYLEANENINFHELGKVLQADFQGTNALLIFDDFQRVEAKIMQFFNLLLEVLTKVEGRTKIIVVGRQILPFYDRTAVSLKKNVFEMQLQGLDEDSSRAILEKANIHLDQESFKRVYDLTKGHPLFLELIHSIDEIKSHQDIRKYIQDEIFSRLDERERKMLQIISVYRYPVSSSAILIEDGLEYDVLNNLIRRSLVQEIGYDTYDCHDMIRDFFYLTLSTNIKRSYHREAAQYYLEIGEERAIIEAIYHFIRAAEYEKAVRLAIGHGQGLIVKGLTEGFLSVIDELPLNKISEEYWPELTLLKADLLTLMGDYDKASGYYNQAILTADKYKNDLVYCEANRKLGQILFRRGEHDKAEGYYKIALDKATQIVDKGGIADSYRALGNLYIAKGDFTKAIEYLLKALESAKDIEDGDIIARIHIDLGTVYSNTGESEKAIEYYERALEDLKGREDRYQLAVVMNALGIAYASIQDYDKALEYYETAMNIAEDIGDVRQLGMGLMNASEVYIKKGMYHHAAQYLEDAQNIFTKLGEKFILSHIYRTYAVIYKQRRDFENATLCLNNALKILKDMKAGYYLVRIYEDFSSLYEEMGDVRGAEAFRKKAESLKKGLKEKLKRG